MEMEYGKAITYPRQDPGWLMKWGLAGLISIIPVLGTILLWGYGVEIARRVIKDEANPLPEWGDFAGFLMKGLYVFVIRFVYFLPLIIVAVCTAVPLAVIGAAQSGGNDNETLSTIAGFVGTCLGCVGLVYGLVAGMMVEAAIGRYAASEQIGEALRVAEVWQMVRAKPGMYLIVLLLSALLTALLTSLGVIVCVIGAAFGAAYAGLISAHLHGQAYRYVMAQRGQ
jgi:hypothetical protein